MRRSVFLLSAAVAAGACASMAQAQFIVSPFRLRGEPAPGMGANFFTFDRGNVSESGAILYLGDTDGATTADDFVFVNNTLVAREGDAAPGVAGGILGTFSLLDTGAHINASNNTIFESSLTGIATTENVTLYTAVGGVLTPVAREGTPAAGIAGRLYSTGFNFPGIFNDNNFGFFADLDGATTDDSVIYRGATPIYRQGTQVPFLPAGTTWDADFTDGNWNGAGQLLFMGNTNLATNDQILVRDTGGVGVIVKQEGDAIAANGGPDTIELFLQVAIAENGKWAFRGNLAVAPATSDSFILTEDGFYRQEGEAVPELPGVVTGNLNAIDMNSTGDVLSLCDLIGAVDPNIDEGLFFNDLLIITDGVQAPGLPAGTLLTDIAFEEAFINDAGLMVFGSSYSDGVTAGDGIFTVLVPEPGALSLLGMMTLSLIRRRR